ncbi:hypothetical protein FACS1894163_04700 [Spirochaetia bacterium]|nr:hypothetical protein FACS1894163_04700 [Spirochaetia bacterium]
MLEEVSTLSNTHVLPVIVITSGVVIDAAGLLKMKKHTIITITATTSALISKFLILVGFDEVAGGAIGDEI